MTKKSFVSVSRVVLLLILMSLLLTGCECRHDWQAADCNTPKTCSKCNATEGEVLDHTWADATCETPKTCTACNKTEGDALGHKWEDATTEAPKTCSVCQKTEGEAINTDPRFTTAASKELFGTWKGIYTIPGTFIDPAFTKTLDMEISFIFNNDGSYQHTVKITNQGNFIQSAEQFYIDEFYKAFAILGLSKDQANEAMKAQYGKDVRGYSQMLAAAYNLETLFERDDTGVYYVADGKVYTGEKWDGTLQSDTYFIAGNLLSMEAYPGASLTKS